MAALALALAGIAGILRLHRCTGNEGRSVRSLPSPFKLNLRFVELALARPTAALGLHTWPNSATTAAHRHLAVLMLGSVHHSLATGS